MGIELALSAWEAERLRLLDTHSHQLGLQDGSYREPLPDRKRPPCGGQRPATPGGLAAGVVAGLGELR